MKAAEGKSEQLKRPCERLVPREEGEMKLHIPVSAGRKGKTGGFTYTLGRNQEHAVLSKKYTDWSIYQTCSTHIKPPLQLLC